MGWEEGGDRVVRGWTWGGRRVGQGGERLDMGWEEGGDKVVKDWAHGGHVARGHAPDWYGVANGSARWVGTSW